MASDLNSSQESLDYNDTFETLDELNQAYSHVQTYGSQNTDDTVSPNTGVHADCSDTAVNKKQTDKRLVSNDRSVPKNVAAQHTENKHVQFQDSSYITENVVHRQPTYTTVHTNVRPDTHFAQSSGMGYTEEHFHSGLRGPQQSTPTFSTNQTFAYSAPYLNTGTHHTAPKLPRNQIFTDELPYANPETQSNVGNSYHSYRRDNHYREGNFHTNPSPNDYTNVRHTTSFGQCMQQEPYESNQGPSYNQYWGQSRVPISRREKEPDKFDGKSVEWKDYVVQFEEVARWNCWDEREMAQQLCMSLRGTAQKLLGDLTPEQLHSYSELKHTLAQRFNPQEREAAYRCEFRTRCRRKGENPSDFGYALRRLGCLAFPDIPHNARELYVIDQFIQGLGSLEIRKHVQFHHPKTLEAAISLAIEFEAFEGSSNLSNQRKPHSVRFEDEVLPVNIINSEKLHKKEAKMEAKTSEMGVLINTMKTCFENLSKQLRSTSPSRSVECYKCHEMGHYSMECPQNTRARSPDRLVECYNCHEKGHYSRDCPHSRRDRSRSRS